MSRRRPVVVALAAVVVAATSCSSGDARIGKVAAVGAVAVRVDSAADPTADGAVIWGGRDAVDGALGDGFVMAANGAQAPLPPGPLQARWSAATAANADHSRVLIMGGFGNTEPLVDGAELNLSASPPWASLPELPAPWAVAAGSCASALGGP